MFSHNKDREQIIDQRLSETFLLEFGDVLFHSTLRTCASLEYESYFFPFTSYDIWRPFTLTVGARALGLLLSLAQSFPFCACSTLVKGNNVPMLFGQRVNSRRNSIGCHFLRKRVVPVDCYACKKSITLFHYLRHS